MLQLIAFLLEVLFEAVVEIFVGFFFERRSRES
jgi:hypothetical protein